jgi:ketosteroid isomerase-like protein
MQSKAHKPSDLATLGREWIDAWNARDLERVLALYSDDFEMTSELIQRLGFEASGTLRGKSNVRAYWAKALTLVGDLHFELIDTYVSPDSVAVFYQNERGKKICEYLRCDAAGKIVQGSANHLA